MAQRMSSASDGLSAVAALVDESGVAPARRRPGHRTAGDAKIQRYQRLQAESETLAGESSRASSTRRRASAGRSELMTPAAPGFSSRVVEFDAQAAALDGRIARLGRARAAIREAVETAKRRATEAIRIAAGGVERDQYLALVPGRAKAAQAIPAAIGEAPTRPAAVEKAILMGASNAPAGPEGSDVDAFPAAAPPEEPADAACQPVGGGEQAP